MCSTSWWPWSEAKPEPPLMQDLTLRRLRKEWDNWLAKTPPGQIALCGVGAGMFITIGSLCVAAKFFLRYSNGDWITRDMLASKPRIRGYVTRVGDSDNFRLYHTPGFGWKTFRKIPQKPEDLKDETIHIRIAGIDAPESFGREPQPGAKESLKWLKEQVEGKFVDCQLLQRDQYGRIIADVLLKSGFSTESVGVKMLRAGHATLYKLQDAVYGEDGVAAYKRAEEEAQAQKRGIWKDGTDIETPAEYKRRVRGAHQAADGEPASSTSTAAAGVLATASA